MTRRGGMLKRVAALVVLVCGALLVTLTVTTHDGSGGRSPRASAEIVKNTVPQSPGKGCAKHHQSQEDLSRFHLRTRGAPTSVRLVAAPDSLTPVQPREPVCGSGAFSRQLGGCLHAVSRQVAGDIPARLQNFRC